MQHIFFKKIDINKLPFYPIVSGGKVEAGWSKSSQQQLCKDRIIFEQSLD